MKLDGKATFWGKDFDDAIDEKTKEVLGLDLELYKPGKNDDVSKANQEALNIIKDHTNKWLNARQVMLKYKTPHGSGADPQFPTEEQVNDSMRAGNKATSWKSSATEA